MMPTMKPTMKPTMPPSAAPPRRLSAISDMLRTFQIEINGVLPVGTYNLRVGITGMFKQSNQNATMMTFYNVLGAPNLDTQILLYDSRNVSVWMKNNTLIIAEPMPLSVEIGKLSIPLVLGLNPSGMTNVYPLGCKPPYNATDYNTFGWLTNDYEGHPYFPSGHYLINLYWHPSGINLAELSMYEMMGKIPPFVHILNGTHMANSFIVHGVTETSLTIGSNADLNITTAFNTSTLLKYQFVQKRNKTISYNSSEETLDYDSTKSYDQVRVSVPKNGLTVDEGVKTYIRFLAYDCLDATVLFNSSVQVNISSSSNGGGSSSSSGLGADAIAGIVIACVLIVAIASLWFWTKPKDADYQHMTGDE